MAPKQNRVYAHGRSKFVTLSARMFICSDDERDPEYMSPSTSTPSRAARATIATPKKVASGVVTASQSDEERTLTSTPSGSASNEEGVSGSLGVSWSEEDSSSAKPNRWCVDGQFRVYSDAKFLNDKGVMTRTITLEWRVLTGSLPTMPKIHSLFSRHLLEWTERPLGCYSKEMVRGFYASYVATLRSQIGRRASPAKQAPVEQIVKDGQFLRQPSVRENAKKWMALHLSVDGEGADWVTEPKGAIMKANLTFTTMFLWLIVRHCLSPTSVDNIVIWDRAVLMAAMIAGFEVDFAWLLQAVMHERAFKVTTTYPFPCMIFSLCRYAGVPIWHVDQLKTPQGSFDVGLIRDGANELVPRRGPCPELPPLADDLADTAAQDRMATQAASTYTTPVESIPGSITSQSSSRTAPLPALVPLARRKMVQHTERKIAEVHQRLDVFELRVLAWPDPPVDVSTLQAAVDSLRADIGKILEARLPESEALSVEPAEDTVLAALFVTSEIPPPLPREHDNRHMGRAKDEARARKKERRVMEAIAEGTADCAVVAEDTTEGVQITEEAGFGEPDPQAC
ncbi:hypothetical protein EJD97_001678 [Solanum chilense]|uniref:Putative plant transposon protein domain-containing protein n=1 Tax=Solanum chilense TaxID=4083 RepID=A0A6N2AP55_SOLCI|nr:hypothetical protein EJD97_001678 [Solanum chilense]